MAYIGRLSYPEAIAKGLITGASSWSKIGYNGDVDTPGTEDMIPQGGQYEWLASEAQLDIKSDSADDDGDPVGTGARTVTLYYLDDDYVEKTETVTLNGTAAVATAASDIYRIQNFRVTTAGTGGAAAGNITIHEHGATTKTYGKILAGHTRMRQCIWSVPTGKVLYINSIYFGIGGSVAGKYGIFTTLAKYDDKALAIRDFFVPYHEIILIDASHTKELNPPTKLPAGVDLKVRIQALDDNCVTVCALRGWTETV